MFGVALLTSTLLALADARIYERCELARDLQSLGIKKEHLATWVCIAYHESRFDTAARNPSSGDHGLLQISEIYWCGAGKVCGLPCSALRDEDISDDVECALRIYEEHTRLQGNGFLAWVVYPHHCKHNTKKYLADCESSVKPSSVRTDGRVRVLKSQNRNYTDTLSYNANIDKLLPPYLIVGSLLRGNYEKVFEENYIEHGKVDWVNYKLDNVDELKLPVFNQEVSERYTTTTSTSTSTTPSPLPNIKPPSPRRIESDSFRRRKNRPLKELNVKINETTKIPTTPARILTSTVTPQRKSSSTKNRGIEEVILNPTTMSKSAATLSFTATTIRPSSRNDEYFAPFTSRTTKTKNAVFIETTTIPTALVEAKPRNTTQPVSVLTIDTDKRSPAVKKSPNELFSPSSEDKKPTLKHGEPSVSLKKASIPIVVSKIKESEYKANNTKSEVTTSTLKPSTAGNVHKNSFIYEVNRVQSTATTFRPSSRSWPTWSTTSRPRTTSTTRRPSTVNWRTAKSWSSTFNETVSATTSTSISLTPPTQRRRQLLPKLTTLSISNNNTTATKGSLVQITTIKPRTTWPLYGRTVSRSTPSPVTTSKTSTGTKNIATSTESPASTTTRTTQSIFDLYLNPTKRPKLPTFSFPPFKSSGHSLKIFAGGTTTITPSILKKPNPSEEAAKNQLRRQA